MTDKPDNTPSAPIEHVYANVMAAHGSAFDIALDFGHRVKDEPPEFAVRVSMSWEHAVSMVTVLQNLIEHYQGEVGAVPDVEKALKGSASAEDNQ